MTGYVIFYEAPVRPWYFGWLKKGFGHCFVFLEQSIYGADVLIRVENLMSNFIVDIRLANKYDLFNYLKALDNSVRCVEFNFDLVIKPKFVLSFLTCVTIVKKALCINDFSILTPWALYRYLLNNNGTEIKLYG